MQLSRVYLTDLPAAADHPPITDVLAAAQRKGRDVPDVTGVAKDQLGVHHNAHVIKANGTLVVLARAWRTRSTARVQNRRDHGTTME